MQEVRWSRCQTKIEADYSSRRIATIVMSKINRRKVRLFGHNATLKAEIVPHPHAWIASTLTEKATKLIGNILKEADPLQAQVSRHPSRPEVLHEDTTCARVTWHDNVAKINFRSGSWGWDASTFADITEQLRDAMGTWKPDADMCDLPTRAATKQLAELQANVLGSTIVSGDYEGWLQEIRRTVDALPEDVKISDDNRKDANAEASDDGSSSSTSSAEKKKKDKKRRKREETEREKEAERKRQKREMAAYNPTQQDNNDNHHDSFHDNPHNDNHHNAFSLGWHDAPVWQDAAPNWHNDVGNNWSYNAGHAYRPRKGKGRGKGRKGGRNWGKGGSANWSNDHWANNSRW